MLRQYDVKEVEARIREFWDKEKIYKFRGGKKIFSIDTPPPYLSGKIHIGHAFQYSQMDFIARFRRMQGSVFYPFGTDDNGLPTERYVEKLKNIKSKSMSRASFIQLCLGVLKEMTPGFIQDYKDLAISSDYDIYYSTIDDNSRKISQKSFVELFKKKRIYKKEFPTIWCPECQTAIAQAELEDKEESSLFSTLRFKVYGKDLLIATTRPELLGACVAVFVHPKDKRYRKLIGKKARVPLFNYEVPIIADESADMKKGTGVLMVCSYGDKYDIEAIQKHKLTPKIVLNQDGTINIGKYKGAKIREARRRILDDLARERFIEKQKQIKHVVNVHDKCGTCVEFITTEQWFIKILDLKKKLIEQGKKINWYPKFMFKRFENWIKGLEWDWSISRDRHFGVPIPVWSCEACSKIILPGKDELPVDPLQKKKKCPICKKDAKGEEKVLDTWATSSLTPQIAASLTRGIKLPFSIRPQSHDIIRTWAFYTITKAYLHEKKIPWEDIMVSGFVTLEGSKMSKSKGIGVQPKEAMEKYSADALRYWAAGSKLGSDMDYQEKDLVTGKKFLNKLWNANRFVSVALKDYKEKHHKLKRPKLEKIDELFLRKLNSLVKTATESFEEYEYARAKSEAEGFFWHNFADNYLEIVKRRIYNTDGNEKLSAQYTLYKSFLTILKLISPIMPFITEEIYQSFFRKFEKDKSIHISQWPRFEKEKQTRELDLFYEVLGKVRKKKAEAKKSVKAEIVLYIDKKEHDKLREMLQDLKSVVNAREIKQGKFRVEIV